MADTQYHVGCAGLTGTIYAGTVKQTKSGEVWAKRSVVTEEAIRAVRDHMQLELEPGFNIREYKWTKKDGTVIKLSLTVELPKKEDPKKEGE